LFAIINKARMLNGWSAKTAQELDPTIRTWAEAFGFYSIPTSAYNELYQRAFETRQRRMSDGKDVPQMDATLLVAHWTGPNGLQSDLRQRDIDTGRTLTATSAAACEKCFGTLWAKTDPTNRLSPVTRCDHQP